MTDPRSAPSFLCKLNGPWHKWTLRVFMAIVLAHLAEHLVQAFQVYALHRPVHESRGVLGQLFPWLVHSEVLHYGYAVIMLAGIWMLLPGFVGRARGWWLAALVIQFWHHIEHALLQGQVIVGSNLFGSPVPVSIVQLWIPRGGAASPVQLARARADGRGHVLPSVPDGLGTGCDAVRLRASPRSGDGLKSRGPSVFSDARPFSPGIPVTAPWSLVMPEVRQWGAAVEYRVTQPCAKFGVHATVAQW